MIPGLRKSLEKRKATHSSILAWRIPWTVQSIGWQKSLTRPSNFHFSLPVTLTISKIFSEAQRHRGIALPFSFSCCLNYSRAEKKNTHRSHQYIGTSRVIQWERTRLAIQELKRPGFNPWIRKIPWRRKWHPTPVFLPGNPMDRGDWWAPFYLSFSFLLDCNCFTVLVSVVQHHESDIGVYVCVYLYIYIYIYI